MGAGTVAALAQHLHLQFPGRCREAAAAYTDAACGEAREHMHAKQGVHPLHGTVGQHPGRALGCFLRGLKEQPHPGGELISQRRQDACHPKPHRGVDVVAAGVHQALMH